MNAARARTVTGRTQQRGFALASMLAAALAFVLLLVSAMTLAAARRVQDRQMVDQSAQLAALRVALSDWYELHLAELDSPGLLPPPLAPEPLRAASKLHVELGELQLDRDVPGRKITAWTAPGPSRPMAVGADSFPVQSGPPTLLVDGRALERAALMRARRQLQTLAARLEIWFQARVADDPLHRLDRNHFRPHDAGCLALPGELPCLAEYAAADSQAFWRSALAIGPEALRSPWGDCCPVEVSNGQDASQEPPYSMVLRIRTPWGQLLQAQAVQPGI